MNYTSNTKYIDIDTGEIIQKRACRLNYIYDKYGTEFIIIKTTKNAKTDFKQGKCHIEYIRQCKRNPQTRLELN